MCNTRGCKSLIFVTFVCFFSLPLIFFECRGEFALKLVPPRKWAHFLKPFFIRTQKGYKLNPWRHNPETNRRTFLHVFPTFWSAHFPSEMYSLKSHGTSSPYFSGKTLCFLAIHLYAAPTKTIHVFFGSAKPIDTIFEALLGCFCRVYADFSKSVLHSCVWIRMWW